jgi:hypothetical protein
MSTKNRIPIAQKQAIADWYRRDDISVKDLADFTGIPQRTIESIINTHPLREHYHQIFGDNTDIPTMDRWVREQMQHYYSEGHAPNIISSIIKSKTQ